MFLYKGTPLRRGNGDEWLDMSGNKYRHVGPNAFEPIGRPLGRPKGDAMKITIEDDSRAVRLNTLPRGALCMGRVTFSYLGGDQAESMSATIAAAAAKSTLVVMDPARGTGESDTVLVTPLRELGRGTACSRASGRTLVVRLYITGVTLSENPS